MSSESAAQIIKQFCKLAASYNVTHFSGTYDGAGDSGDMDLTVAVRMPAPAMAGPHNHNDQIRVITFRNWVDDVTTKENTLIDKKLAEQFEDACFHLLPMGWEINDGSYGDLTIDVGDENITVEHNERYTEVRSETHTF